MTRIAPRLAVLPVSLLLAGCAATPFAQTSVSTRAVDVGRGESGAQAARAYDCDDGGRVHVLATRESARVDLGDRLRRLDRASDDAGIRYGGGALELHLRGDRLRLISPAGERECRYAGPAGPWADAALRGVEVRAIGHEPSWSVEIVPQRWLHFVPMGEGEALLALDPVSAVGTDGTHRYTARGVDRELRVRVREAACIDSMRGDRFPLRVVVEVDGRTLQGCGRRLQTPAGPPVDAEPKD